MSGNEADPVVVEDDEVAAASGGKAAEILPAVPKRLHTKEETTSPTVEFSTRQLRAKKPKVECPCCAPSSDEQTGHPPVEQPASPCTSEHPPPSPKIARPTGIQEGTHSPPTCPMLEWLPINVEVVCNKFSDPSTTTTTRKPEETTTGFSVGETSPQSTTEEFGGWNETETPPTTPGGLRANEDPDFDYMQVEWELYELALSGWKKVWSVRADRFGGVRSGLFVRPTGVYWQRFRHNCTPKKEVTCNGDDKGGFDLLEKLPLVKGPAILNDDEPRTTAHGSGDLCTPPDFRLYLEDPEDKLRVCA
ncbi:hypothetical protein M3Y99_00475400 [Aphelenchoides fujianensis]|nr:hypothetical protein M3Y99_00475400 [Aphelenchoides fujianensis]